MKVGNTGHSVENENGFTMKQFWRKASYLKKIDDNRTVWATRGNPTTVCPKEETTWSVFITSTSSNERDKAPEASGFKTHGDAEKWANENIN